MGNTIYSEINVAHRSYDPLAYPLLFPFGEDGWHLDKEGKKSTYSPRQFYRYKLFDRETEFNTLLHANRLFQQYITDQFLK